MVNKTPEQPTDAQQASKPEQGELFICEIANWPVKDDVASMEIPLFSLSKNTDIRMREWRRGNKVIRVIPSSIGAATVFDKDLLLYCASQIIEAMNLGKPIAKTIKIDSYDFLMSTHRNDSRPSYEGITGMLRRLKGTIIETNIETGNIRQLEGFSAIDGYKVLSEKKRMDKRIDPETGKSTEHEVSRVLSFTVTLSDWLWNGLMNFEVLTLDRSYFRLSKSIERRLYEIARKHCGDQPYWKINIDLLAEKVGTSRPRYKFRDELREVLKEDTLPEYYLALDCSTKPDDVVFYTRDNLRLSKVLINKPEILSWFMTLERKNQNPYQNETK